MKRTYALVPRLSRPDPSQSSFIVEVLIQHRLFVPFYFSHRSLVTLLQLLQHVPIQQMSFFTIHAPIASLQLPYLYTLLQLVIVCLGYF